MKKLRLIDLNEKYITPITITDGNAELQGEIHYSDIDTVLSIIQGDTLIIGADMDTDTLQVEIKGQYSIFTLEIENPQGDIIQVLDALDNGEAEFCIDPPGECDMEKYARVAGGNSQLGNRYENLKVEILA